MNNRTFDLFEYFSGICVVYSGFIKIMHMFENIFLLSLFIVLYVKDLAVQI